MDRYNTVSRRSRVALYSAEFTSSAFLRVFDRTHGSMMVKYLLKRNAHFSSANDKGMMKRTLD